MNQNKTRKQANETTRSLYGGTVCVRNNTFAVWWHRLRTKQHVRCMVAPFAYETTVPKVPHKGEQTFISKYNYLKGIELS